MTWKMLVTCVSAGLYVHEPIVPPGMDGFTKRESFIKELLEVVYVLQMSIN